MAGSDYLFKYLGTVWDNLPNKERQRFAEVWKGYEQVLGDSFQRFLELNQTVNINTMPVFLTTRWNKYDFNDVTKVTQAAELVAFQDISLGLNLTDSYLLSISVNGEAPIEVDCRGRVPSETTITEVKAAINKAFAFNFASGAFSDTVIKLTTRAKGPEASIEILTADDAAKDAAELILGITNIEIPYKVPQYPHVYKLPDTTIKKIPSLQDTVRIESLEYYIIDGPDFTIDRATSTIRFIEEPPELLWPKVTYLDERMPFYNFGYLIDYVDSSISAEDYLQNLQGLWFAFWQGPRPDYIKRALYLLFSLPVAVQNGVITSKKGNILEVLHSDGIVRGYVLPSQLNWVVSVGEYVERFQPLVDGIDVFDKTNLPRFVQTEIGRDALQIFALPEATRGSGPDTDETKAVRALEEHTFLPQINVNAFVRPNVNVGAIFNFLQNIKPLQKAFYFQVIVAIFNEDVGLQDKTTWDINIDITPNLDINQANTSTESDRNAYEFNPRPELDMDSDLIYFGERGGLSFSDISGPLPINDVVFD